MEDEWGYSRTRGTAGLIVGGMALALVALLGAVTVYLAMRVAILDKEIARLHTAQTELKTTVQALQTSAPAGSSNTPAASPAATVPAAPEIPASPAASPPANMDPALRTTAPAAGAAPETANPAPAAERYSVRIFASPGTSNKSKLERFVNVVRSLGFDVDVSENSISDSMSSSMLYQPSALNVANKLASSLKAKYPSLNFEMNTGEINDNLKRVLIVSLNQDALN